MFVPGRHQLQHSPTAGQGGSGLGHVGGKHRTTLQSNLLRPMDTQQIYCKDSKMYDVPII